LTSDTLRLAAPGGSALTIRVRTELGKALVRQLGPEAEYWDDRQCVVERGSDGRWTVKSLGPTTNQTLVNGRALTTARVLSQGDLIAVGNEAKGVAKLPLSVGPA
jgi:hypothetical protein